MKLTHILAAALLGLPLLMVADPAQSKPTSCPVAGDYWLVGRVPNAPGVYRGKTRISAKGGGCHMRWFPPNDSEGTGTYANGVLTISFRFSAGGNGVVRYTRSANGEMHGIWWMNNTPSNQGVETLSPFGPPQLAALPPPPAAPSMSARVPGDWVLLNTTNAGQSLYYKVIGPSPADSSLLRMHVRLENSTPFFRDEFPIYSTLSIIDGDCSGRRYREAAEGIAYAGRNLTGQGYRVAITGEWRPAIDRSAQWLSGACGY